MMPMLGVRCFTEKTQNAEGAPSEFQNQFIKLRKKAVSSPAIFSS
jgi:hypothetical protein